MFSNDPGQRITKTVIEFVYNNSAEGINKLKHAFMEVRQNKNDPTKGKGQN